MKDIPLLSEVSIRVCLKTMKIRFPSGLRVMEEEHMGLLSNTMFIMTIKCDQLSVNKAKIRLDPLSI